MDRWQQERSGYASIQSTRPQTLAYALADSPIGQLAWNLEWFDDYGHHVGAIDDDKILDTVTLTCSGRLDCPDTGRARAQRHALRGIRDGRPLRCVADAGAARRRYANVLHLCSLICPIGQLVARNPIQAPPRP